MDDEASSHTLYVDLSPDEHATLQLFATETGIPISAIVRAALADHIRQHSLDLDLTLPATGDLEQAVTTDEDLLRCTHCSVPWMIERVDTGWAAVRPDSWWRPTMRHWVARCACRVLHGDSEGDLYRAMGMSYC